MTQPDIAPSPMADPTAEMRTAPYLLSLPALLLFVGVVLIPIAMTVLLSFHDWGQYKGIDPVLILKNWREVVSDGYFHEMFLRTFRIALLVTVLTAVLGAPEAYILSRMRAPWRSIFLLVVLGPLLISVVARTLGWALLFGGSSGVINKALINWASFPPALHVHRDRCCSGAHARSDAVHGALQCGRAAATRPADRERRGLPRRQSGPFCAASCFRRSFPAYCRAQSSCLHSPPARSRRRRSSAAGGSRWPPPGLRRVSEYAQLAPQGAVATLCWPRSLSSSSAATAWWRAATPRCSDEPQRSLALAFHLTFVVFMLAPILIVCAVAFTPEGYLSFPTRTLSAVVQGDRPLSRIRHRFLD